MTREEARGNLIHAIRWNDMPKKEALEMAITELQQEPCADAISREAVLKAIDAKAWEFCDYLISKGRNDEQKPVSHFADNLRECISEALPPVKPRYTDAEIQKMQDLEFAEIQKAYEIGKAENPNKWIPVSERLPEDGQNVLFSTKTDRVFEGKYYADTSAHNWLSYKDDTYAWNNVVTAWMPLPEPYKASPTGGKENE